MPAALTSPAAATPADSAPTDGGDPAHLRRDWTLAVALGELVGFVPPAVTGATLARWGHPTSPWSSVSPSRAPSRG